MVLNHKSIEEQFFEAIKKETQKTNWKTYCDLEHI